MTFLNSADLKIFIESGNGSSYVNNLNLTFYARFNMFYVWFNVTLRHFLQSSFCTRSFTNLSLPFNYINSLNFDSMNSLNFFWLWPMYLSHLVTNKHKIPKKQIRSSFFKVFHLSARSISSINFSRISSITVFLT